MDTVLEKEKTFIQVSEVWVSEGDQLVLGGGNFGNLAAFEEASRA